VLTGNNNTQTDLDPVQLKMFPGMNLKSKDLLSIGEFWKLYSKIVFKTNRPQRLNQFLCHHLVYLLLLRPTRLLCLLPGLVTTDDNIAKQLACRLSLI